MRNGKPWKLLASSPERHRDEFWDTHEYQKAVKRVQKLSKHEILDWLDQAGTGMERLLSNYRKDGDPTWLDILMPSVSALQAAVEELVVREQTFRGA